MKSGIRIGWNRAGDSAEDADRVRVTDTASVFADCGDRQFVYYFIFNPVHGRTVPCRSRVVEYTTVQEALRYRSGGDNDQRTPSAGWLAGSMISIICFTKRRRFIWARSSPTPG